MNTPDQTEIEERCWMRVDRAVYGVIALNLLAAACGIAAVLWS